MNRRQAFFRGMRRGIPVVLGFIPVGIAYAVMARQAGFTVGQTCGLSLSVFAGASQMMAVGMYSQGATVIAMIVATFLINFRHLIMSTCVYDRMTPTRLPLRLLSAFGVTDESFALFTTSGPADRSVWYFLGMNLVMYSSWNVGSLIGAVASDLLPAIVTASLGIALYAMFVGLLIPNVKGNGRLCILVLLTAVCNTVLSAVLSSSESLVISTLLCAFVGVFFVDLEEEGGEEDG